MFWSRSNGAGEQAKQQHPSLEDAPKCRIVVVGNPGVGKTSFVHLLANGSVLLNPRWTCGCYLEVVAHVRENQANVMELWDVGANPKFKKSRRVFYKPLPSSSSPMSQEQPDSDIDGIILVHDLSNRKSYANLTGWLREVMREISETNEIVFDHDLLFNGGNNSLPVIVIGTKADLINQDSRASELLELGIDSIDISTQNPDTFAHDSMAFAKISAFFDKVVANRDKQHLMQQRREEYGEGTVSPIATSPTARHPVLDSFEGQSAYPSNQYHRHYSAVTRNQRATITPRSMVDDELSPFEPVGTQMRWTESPQNTVPHSRNSKVAYTNILDAP